MAVNLQDRLKGGEEGLGGIHPGTRPDDASIRVSPDNGSENDSTERLPLLALAHFLFLCLVKKKRKRKKSAHHQNGTEWCGGTVQEQLLSYAEEVLCSALCAENLVSLCG